MAGARGLSPTEEVRRRARLPDGDLVVALSGGADSAVCAWVAVAQGRSVRAVFVDHGFDESPQLAQAAREVAAALEIELDEVSVTVPAGPSPEDQARQARHAALIASLKPGEALLSGHTADDQAETVVANLIRGAGAAGLGGIPYRREPWVRPLLDVPRDTVRAAAQELGLPFTDDPANDSTEPRRNQLRAEVMPLLRGFNPEVTAAIGRAARLAAADDAHIESRAEAVSLARGVGVVKIPAAALLTLPAPVASRVARRALREARGPYGGEAAEVEAIIAAAAGPAATLGGGLEVRREGPWVALRFGAPAEPAAQQLQVPGITAYWAGTIEASSAVGPKPIGPQVTLAPPGMLEVVPASSVDRIDFGQGSKQVADALAEGGVPPVLRASWPVVTADGGAVWIVGVRSAPVVPAEAVATLSARLEVL